MRALSFFIITCALMLSAILITLNLRPQNNEETFEYNGQTRRYALLKPDQVLAPAPLVIFLHNAYGNVYNLLETTRIDKHVVKDGGILVMPFGTGPQETPNEFRTWNAVHCCGAAMENNTDDIGFISGLIDHLIATENIDPNRVYILGASNGGMLAQRIGAVIPDKIAAIGSLIGTLFGDEQVPPSPVNAILINGQKDTVIPFEGGTYNGEFSHIWRGTPSLPVMEQSAFWAKANNCDLMPTTTQGSEITITKYACPDHYAVEHYVYKNQGHFWTTSLEEPTKIIWEFFKAHPKPNTP